MEQDLEYVIRHVFLPPKLPQQDDSGSRHGRLLTQLVKDVLESAAALSSGQCPWASMSTMMNVMLDENDDGAMSTSALNNDLVSLNDNGESSLSPIECMATTNFHHRSNRSSYPQSECRPHHPKIESRVFLRSI